MGVECYAPKVHENKIFFVILKCFLGKMLVIDRNLMNDFSINFHEILIAKFLKNKMPFVGSREVWISQF